MKPSRSFINISVIAALCLSTLSCIDNSYDLSNLSKKAELFKNSLSAPVGTATIYLDSIIGGMDVDTSILTVKNGMYVFEYSGNFDLGNFSNKFNTFKLSTVETPPPTHVYLYDARNVPESQLPFDLPTAESQNFTGAISINLPANFGKTELIDIDSILLKNTFIKLSAAHFGLDGGNGKSLGDNISITFTAEGNAADYYRKNKTTKIWEKTNTWPFSLGETDTIMIGKIRLTNANNKLDLNSNIWVQIAEAGDVKVTDNIKTHIDFNLDFIDGIDYDRIWGKVDYGLPGNLSINFDGLGKIIGDNDVLSIYNPKINIKTESNVGIPVDLDLNVSTLNSNTGKTAPAVNKTFRMIPTNDPNVMKSNSFTIDRTDGTDGLFKINPDLIRLNYNAQTDTSTSNHFLTKNTQLNVSYKMEVPLQFGGDLRIGIDTTLENPFAGKLDQLEEQDNLSVILLLNVQNRIPLTMQIELEALDMNGDSLFTVQTAPIEAAKTSAGVATTYTETQTQIPLTSAQINLIKKTEMFKICFLVTAKEGEAFVTVQPSDYITIKIGGKINGGVLFDFSSTSK